MEENYQLAKWLSGEMTENELEAFQKSPEYSTYLKIANYSKQLETPGFDETVLYNNVVKETNTKGKVVHMQKQWMLRVAAILVLALGLFLSCKILLPKQRWLQMEKEQLLIYQITQK